MTTISEVIELLTNHDGTLMILLGAGASREGVRSDGSAIPGFGEIQDELLTAHGYSITDPTEVKQKKFLELVEKHQDHVLELMRDMLGGGSPNKAHIELVSFCMARVREKHGRSTLIITTNYDSLAEDAYKAIVSDEDYVRPISFSREDRLEHSLAEANKHINKGRIVVIHLWGDFDYANPVFYEKGMTFPANVREFLLGHAKNPVLSIGYSFSDRPLLEIINQASMHPVFVVDKKLDLKEPEKRKFVLLDCHFAEFMQGTHHHLLTLSKGKNNYLDYLSNFEPMRPHVNGHGFINRIRRISELSLERLRKKLPRGGSNTLILRSDVERAVDHFLASDRELFALVGEAGMGKSTLVYQLAEKWGKSNKLLTLTLDPSYFQPSLSFSAQLSQEFSFPAYQLDAWFAALHAYLEMEDLKLLIQIDAINELSDQQPHHLKNELERLADKGVFESRIKVLYTCRKIYWDTVLGADLVGGLYHLNGVQSISKFNDLEASLAFENFKREYYLLGNWTDLDETFRRTLTDPLMMHMMAKAYEGGATPHFAPAVSVFNAYLTQLDKKQAPYQFPFQSAVIQIGKDFLAGTNGYSLEQKRFNYDHQFAASFKDGKSNIDHAYKVLQDERILFPFSSGRRFSFVYERFFEYALGRAFIEQERLEDGYDAKKILALFHKKGVGFSYRQGLKSALVNLSCNPEFESVGDSLFSDQGRLSALINHESEDVRTFIYYCVQEILGESKRTEDFDYVENAIKDRNQFLAFIVNYCAENIFAGKFFIESIFANEERWMENAREGIHLNFLSPSRRAHIETQLEIFLKRADGLTPEHLIGLFFMLSLYFERDVKSSNAGEDILRILRRIVNAVPDRTSFEANLKKSFYLAATRYGDWFFSQDDRHEHFSYFWKMPDDVRQEALKIPTLFRKAHRGDSFSDADIETLRFFCSDYANLGDLHVIGKEDETPAFSYRLEHILARYCVLKIAKLDLEEGMRIFRHFVKSQFWFSIDSALCLAQRVATNYIKSGERERAEEILVEMKQWTEEFATNQPRLFFRALYTKESLQETYNPVNQVAMVEGNLYDYSQKIPYLTKGIDEVIEAQEKGLTPNPADVEFSKLSVLSMRKLVRYFPDAVLLGLKQALKIKGDDTLYAWVRNTFIKLYQYNPKKVSHYLEDWKKEELLKTIIEEAKKEKPDIAGNEWDHDQIAIYFLLSDSGDRLELMLGWYERLFESYDLETFLSELSNKVLRSV